MLRQKRHLIRIIAGVLIALLVTMLCGCGESDSEKLSRLNRDAAQKRQAANEAKAKQKLLERYVGN